MLFIYTQTTHCRNILSLSKEDKTTQHPCMRFGKLTLNSISTLGLVRKNTGSKDRERTP